MILDDHAYNALNKISSRTKMDCWFVLDTDEDGQDVIYDNEEDTHISIAEGVGNLCEGMVDPPEDEFYGLEQIEIKAFRELVDMLGYNDKLMS